MRWLPSAQSPSCSTSAARKGPLRRNSSSCSGDGRAMVSARAHHLHGVPCRRIHVIVHGNHHRNEDDGVIKEMELNAREPDLADTRWYLAAEPVMVGVRLVKQDEVL